ncbi:carbohydrate kinase [Branchiibius sp. NY16-3462-2]|uniref:carbohydrate kinase family protein n=1 Tax=Branchiibius sp. NY16-3462-2 TaxID=1807500 RepID=UPI000797582A|nr:carbohydrate kinase [Branchiibius sp. NY16-3462-2]KYH46037.1 kinase [Branchiibius sp. NY16-3462-2]
MARVLVAGEALIDVVRRVDGSVEAHVGGSPLNVAVGLARLGHDTELATHIAGDPYGALIVGRLGEDGVQLVPGSDTATRTSTAQATLAEDGSASYEFDIDWRFEQQLSPDFGHFHTGSIAAVLQPGAIQVEQAIRAAREHATISFDPNARPSLMGDPHDARAQIEQLIGLSDVVKASDEDIEWLYGQQASLDAVLALWARLGPSLTVATRGPDGARVHLARTGEFADVLGASVDVVDTVGAGDSFQSGLVSGLLDAGLLGGPDSRAALRGASLTDVLPAAARAVACSAITVSRAGANPPHREELPS